MARKLLIVHPGTETIIALDDKVMLVDLADVEDDMTVDIHWDRVDLFGVRLDNANMARLFFGDDV